MNTYPEQLKTLRGAFPIAVAAVISVLLALSKALSSGHMILITTVLGTHIGPVPLTTLAIFDFAIAMIALVGGVAFVLRREWGQRVLVNGAIPIAMYELGRFLGLAVAGVPELGLASAVVAVGLVVSWGLVAWGAASAESALYIASRPGRG